METLELLKKLTSFNTSTLEGVDEAVSFVDHYMSSKGIKGEIIDNKGYKSYVCTIGRGGKTLVLNGHLDVVSADDKMFDPYEKDGRLYGRGTADMKAGCAVFMNTMVKLNGSLLNSKVMLQLVPDEEDGGINGTNHLVGKGMVGDFVIIGEPTMMKISLQSKGFMRLNLHVRGKSAHSSRPWQGVNAVEKAYEVYHRILELPFLEIESPCLGPSTVNISMISGGDAFNKVPESCRLSLDIRYIPELRPDRIIDQIRTVIDDVEVCMIGSESCIADDDINLIRLQESSVRELGQKLEYTCQHGSSDGRFFSEAGVPAIEFGPSGNSWHGDDENVEIDSVKDYERLIIDFASRF